MGQKLDLQTARERLAGLSGKQYWRSLEELAGTQEFEELLRREFPREAGAWLGPVSRRGFLKVMGASLALAGLSACSPEPAEKIVPYVEQPEEIVPGKPLFFATAMPLSGYAIGLLVENHMGRPTKVEGNPQHPASLGATDIWAQASVLSLYDPDRSQAVINRGQISTWNSFSSEILGRLQALRDTGGAGLRILTETVTSPTLQAQITAMLDEFPEARWHQYEPATMHSAREGARQAFGADVNTVYRFDQATRILSLDSDFLYTAPGRLRYAREYIDRRRVDRDQREMNRLYVVESSPTITGAMADHRLALPASRIENLAFSLAAALGINVAQPAGEGAPAEWLQAVVKDLQSERGTSIVIAGDRQPPVVHALAHAINEALGNNGQTVSLTAPVEADPGDQLQSLRTLVDDMNAGSVSTLLIIGGNPVLTAPADFQFREALDKVELRAHLSMFEDETSERCQWHIPETHFLEAWSDARAYDGTISIMQPLIAPLYDGRTAHHMIDLLLGNSGNSDLDMVRTYWQGQFDQPDERWSGMQREGAFEQWWRAALHNGVIEGTAAAAANVSLSADFAAGASPQAQGDAGPTLEISFLPDPSIWDGRFANNGWLQELPKPLTTLTWDNPLLISANTAERLQLNNEDVVEVRFRERSLQMPVWITPGHPNDTITVYLGYGRTRAGQVGNGAGFDTYSLRTSDALNGGAGVELVKVGGSYRLARTQTHYSVENRALVRVGTLEEYLDNPAFAQTDHIVEVVTHHEEEAGAEQETGTGAEGEQPGEAHGDVRQPSLYPEYKYEGYAWGMTINLNACIGCNACVLACQSENNIPVVGKEQVIISREMHWLKVDRYYEGSPDNPQTLFQPRLCMHCENAPCEPVCPVHATSHSVEGLNEMTYNRCVGTRYCSNNCPYKVRRFNYLDYTKQDTVPVLELLANPDVTIRARGVVEKCTYCVQRINHGRIEAEREGRRVRDGEIKTACQEVCPTQAIIFGDINDEESEVHRLKQTPLNYGLLADLGTQPRTTYLARVRNPNPDITEA